MLARQQHRHRRALAEFAAHPDRSAGLMDETMNLRKTKPGTFADRLGREEWVEYFSEDVGSDAGAGILHRDRDIIPGVRRFREGTVTRGNRDRAAARHRVTRVDGEIDQCGLEF